MYSRFTALKNHSQKEQDKLENSTAAIIGLGATGSAIAENLARHGIKLIIFDRDYLEPKDTYSSNLYTPKQCKKGLPKAKAAEQKIQDFTRVKAFAESLSPENIDKISSADIILDGTDNLETRQLINDYSKKTSTPWIYTAAIAQRAYSMPFKDKCFNCMVQKPEKVATCETHGIMRETAQRAAASSSEKTVKLLTNKEIDEKLEIIHQGRNLEVECAGCKVCQKQEFPRLNNFNQTAKVCGENKYQIQKEVTQQNIDSAVETGSKIVENDFLVRIKYEGREITFFRSGRTIVEAESPGHAEALVSEVAGL